MAEATLALPAGQEREVKARTSLPVISVPVGENVPVKKNVLLAEVDVSKLERELIGVRQTLASAQSERRRLVSSQEVVRGGSNPNASQNSGAAQRMMEIATAESDAARDLLDVQTRIVTASVRAPEDGYVVKHLFAAGSKPKKNKLFLVFAEATKTRLSLSLPAAEAAGFQAGSETIVASATDGTRRFRARVETAAANAEQVNLVLRPLELPFLTLGVAESIRLVTP